MANINMASIMSKVRAYAKSAEGKKRIKEYLDECRQQGRAVTEAGSVIVTEEVMIRAAEEMIRILRDTARAHNLPSSVLAHFDALQYSAPVPAGKRGEVYQIDIWFDNSSGQLSRASLLMSNGKRTGEGIKNIVSLFDTGYSHSTSSKVFGIWDNHEELGEVNALEHRDGEWFMSQSIEIFNRLWGEIYDVHAAITADPEFYVTI